MKKILSIITFCLLTFNAIASSIPLQDTSTGINGIFSITTDTALFDSPDNIYNFSDFMISSDTTLSVNSGQDIFIHSQTGMTIDGNISAPSSNLHLIAPEITINGSIFTSLSLSLYADTITIDANTGSGSDPAPTSSIIISDGSGDYALIGDSTSVTIGDLSGFEAGTITPVIIPSEPIFLDNISPVPVPAALWLMLSGIMSLLVLSRRK